MEDFSLNLLCRGQSHLLPTTLDSLKGQSGSFEVLLLDADGAGHLEELVKQYEELPIRIENAKACNLAQMMNLGVAHSRGKYIQFLEPGERYLSPHGLSFLKELLHKEPHLISAHGVLQESKSHWLLRAKILEAGGFDEHLSFRPMLDLLCRFQKQGVEPVLCTRVLVDSSRESIGSIFETCKVLHRHFGLSYTAKWLAENYLQKLKDITASFKNAFFERENQ
jgi:hypothetical protein